MIGQHKRVLAHQLARDANIFGKCAQVHQKVVAKIGLTSFAEVALVAGRRVAGHHPHPHYFGGYCRIRGLHQHGYAPNSGDYYRLKNGAYFFTGVYDSDYYAERTRYDVSGWRLDQRASGYREHERAWRKGRGADTADPANAYRLTPGGVVERMRERTAAGADGAPANRADDGARE